MLRQSQVLTQILIRKVDRGYLKSVKKNFEKICD